MYFARIASDRVAEVVEVADQAELAERYHPDLVAQFVEADKTTTPGMTYDGKVFAPYEPPALTPDQLQAIGIRAAGEAIRPNEAAQATEVTFEQTVSVLAALTRAVVALAGGDTPAAEDVSLLSDAIPTLDTLAGIFTDPDISTLKSMTPAAALDYVRGKKTAADAARTAYEQALAGQ